MRLDGKAVDVVADLCFALVTITPLCEEMCIPPSKRSRALSMGSIAVVAMIQALGERRGNQ
jgi:hypothetical protein